MRLQLIKILVLVSALISLNSRIILAEDKAEILSFESFIELATSKDTEFEQILIDELTLKYQNDIRIPAKDLVLSVKQQHEFYLSQDRDSPDTTVGLSKLFPYSGTELAVDYQVGASLSSADDSSELAFTIAQPIAENAFGRNTRLLEKIVGLEVEVASHQIVEAYEDYLATIITAYYTWYADYQNLLIGQSSYEENLKLLDNMKERQNQKIALPIDVNKVQLQVLSKKENLTELEEKYKNSTNVILRIVRNSGRNTFIPQSSDPLARLDISFDDVFKQFSESSRTFEILRKLENKSTLEVKRDADELLPSINIIAGYEVNGDNYRITNEDNFLYAGVSLEFPFSDQVKKAEYEVSKILNDKQKLSTVNTYHRLYTQLINLHLAIEREMKLIEIADERIQLARAILEDETENYSFGKVTLNDYIQAFNALDNNRFNKINHDSQYKKLIVEWLRLRDRLVHKSEVASQIVDLDKSKNDKRNKQKKGSLWSVIKSLFSYK